MKAYIFSFKDSAVSATSIKKLYADPTNIFQLELVIKFPLKNESLESSLLTVSE